MKKYLFILYILFAIMACSKKITNTAPGAMPPGKSREVYNADIKPVLELKCSPCHFPDKGGHKAAFDSYEAAGKFVEDMIQRVQLDPTAQGYMPFKSKKEAMTAAEIAALKAWKEMLTK